MAAAASGARFLTRRESIGRRFREMCRRIRDAEESFVRELASVNAGTRFGRDHHFESIRSVDDFRRAVPIQTYDDCAAWIEREAAGERGVLVAEPPILFRRTSGTSGASKKIPVTTRSWAADAECLHICFGLPFDRFAAVAARPDAILNTIPNPRLPPPARTESGVVWQAYSEQLGSSTGAGAALEGMPGCEAPWFDSGKPLPSAELTYFRLRVALESDVTGLVAVNPSTLVMLDHNLGAMLPRVVEEMRAGTLFGQPRGEPRRERASELAALLSRGQPHLRDVWPHLAFAMTWKAASCALYLPQLQELVGDRVALLPFAYSASEGFCAVHLDDHATAGLLLPEGALPEFVPADDELLPDSTTLRSDELEAGREYHYVHTAWNGLYRYAIGDVLRVVDVVGGVPRLEFTGRRGAFSSFTGEKLTDRHVVAALEATCRALGATVANFTCCPQWADPPGYVFAIEPAGGKTASEAAWSAELDRQLGVANDEYPSKRSSGRLAPVQVRLLAPGSFVRFREKLIDAGAAAAQLKDKPLQKDDAVLATLLAASGAQRR